jgi:hypothetical protein
MEGDCADPQSIAAGADMIGSHAGMPPAARALRVVYSQRSIGIVHASEGITLAAQ